MLRSVFLKIKIIFYYSLVTCYSAAFEMFDIFFMKDDFKKRCHKTIVHQFLILQNPAKNGEKYFF